MSTDFEHIKKDLDRLAPGWQRLLDPNLDGTDSGLQVFKEILLEKQRPELPIPWPALQEKFGDLRQGELTILTGDTGHGKTTFASNIFYKLICGDYQTLLVSLEMGKKAIVKKFFQHHFGVMQNQQNYDKHLEPFTKWLTEHHFEVLKHSGPLKFRQLKNAVIWAALVKKTQAILIDHFHLLTEPLMDHSQIERMVAELRFLADTLEVAIVLIVHPAKLRSKDGIEREVGMDELKGSSGLKQFADNVLSIFYDKKNSISKVKIHKVRDDRYGQNSGTAITYALDKYLIFKELDNGSRE